MQICYNREQLRRILVQFIYLSNTHKQFNHSQSGMTYSIFLLPQYVNNCIQNYGTKIYTAIFYIITMFSNSCYNFIQNHVNKFLATTNQWIISFLMIHLELINNEQLEREFVLLYRTIGHRGRINPPQSNKPFNNKLDTLLII